MSSYNLDETILSKQLLTDEQCKYLVNRIVSLKEFWLKHPVFKKTFTIGVPICSFRYLNYNKYETLYTYYNKILEEYFQDIKSILCSFVQELFPTHNIKYSDKHGNPGFHIMYSSKNYTEIIHRDHQYKTAFSKNINKYNSNVTLSFTLCLNIPPDGGGLYEYDTSLTDDYMTERIMPNKKILEKLNPRVIQYKPGYIYFHSGNIPHSIIQFKDKNNPRITLQGHGILEESTNSIYLYF